MEPSEGNGQGTVPVVVEDPFELQRHVDTNTLIVDEDEDLKVQRDRMFYGCVFFVLLSVGLGMGWRFWPVKEMVPFVYPIQVDAQTGLVTVLAQPKPLRDFVVPAEVIQQMLIRFVDDWRRQGNDPVENKNRLQYLLAHVCGTTREQMEAIAAERLKMKAEDRPVLVSIAVPVPRPTSSPRTFTVSWDEYWSDAKARPLGKHSYVGDFTVSRYAPKELGVLLRNTMGVCVSSLSLREDLP